MEIAAVALMALGCALARVDAPATAQEQAWTTVYNKPGANVSDLEMLDATHGFALLSSDILRTEDGGATWTEPQPINAPTYGALGIADAEHAWAVTEAGGIWRTTDGGTSWRRQESGTTVHLQSIAALSADEAWVTGSGEGYSDVGPIAVPPSVLLHTTDGGATWRQMTPPVAGVGVFRQVAFAGATGWLIAQRCMPGQPFFTGPGGPAGDPCNDADRVLLRTRDGGRSWRIIAEAPDFVPWQMAWFDERHGAATALTQCQPDLCPGRVWWTEDGGDTWAERGHDLPGAAGEIEMMGRDSALVTVTQCGLAPGCRWQLAQTDDGGRSWKLTDAPELFTEVERAGARTIGAGGATGVAVYDPAQGAWAPAATPTGPALWGVAFATRDVGFAGSSAQGFMRSLDGGATWSPLPIPEPFGGLTASLDGASLWATPNICSGTCPLYRSRNRGDTWQRIDPPFTGGYHVQAAGRRVWVTAEDGLWRSDDDGASWRRLEEQRTSGSYTFFTADFGTTQVCPPQSCEAGTFRVTFDGGETWQQRTLPGNAGVSTFVDSHTGWAVGYDSQADGSCPCTGVLYRTDDGARTWREVHRSSGENVDFSFMTFADARQGWAISYDYALQTARILGTEDGGETWAIESETASPAGHSLVLRDGRAWEIASLGVFGGGLRTIIQRREYTQAPVVVDERGLRPPDTGSGPVGGAGASWLVVAVLGLAAAVIAASSGIAARR